MAVSRRFGCADVAALLVSLCLIRNVVCFTDFVNQAGADFDFQCGQQVPFYGFGISGLASVFQSTTSLQDPADRRWQYRCSNANSLALNTSALTCRSNGLVNRIPGTNPLRFQCPNQGFLTGFQSTYAVIAGDRSWNPYCCEHSFGSVVNCLTTSLENSLTNDLNFSIPTSASNAARRVVTGFEATFVGILPASRDRVWKFTHCELVVNCSRPPTPANGRFVGGGQYLFNETVGYICDDTFYLSTGSAVRTCQNSGQWSGVLPTCTKCTPIADCQDLRCTTATDQYCQRCNSHFPSQAASAFRNSNRTCDALCSWQRNFCYPGSCPSTVDTCQCSDGFEGPSCLTISALPQLSCLVQLASANGTQLQRTSCTNGTSGAPATFYSNVHLSTLHLQWDVAYFGPTPAPTTPVYVQASAYSVGVVATHVTGALTREQAPSDVVASNSLNCTGEAMSPLSPRTTMVQCLANATLSKQPFHNDQYQLSVFVTNGGYLSLDNYDTSLMDRYLYNGSTHVTVTNIVFDFLAPVHCSVGGSLRCAPDQELFDIGSSIIRWRNVTVSFGGWSEPLSAIETYRLERYALEVRGGTVCELAASRTLLSTFPSSSVQSRTSIDIALPDVDAAYSLVLSVEDSAGNVQQARRTLLSDEQSTLRVDPGRPIAVVSTFNSLIDGRTVFWQPDTSGDVRISATGHFYNSFSRQRNFLMPLCDFLTPLASAYDQPTTGLMPRTGTRNAEGVIEMYYSVLVNPADLTVPPDPSTFLRSSSLDVANLTLSISRRDSDTVVVWLRAQDLHNLTASDSVVFLTDSTPPLLSGLSLVVRTERTLVFNSADLTKLAFGFQSQDVHSGLLSLTWAIGTSPRGTDIAQGRVAVPLQNATSCSLPSCVCAQPLAAPCQLTAYSVSLSTMPSQQLIHDHDYFLSVVSINNAGLQTVQQIQFTVDVSPPRGGFVKDSASAIPDVNFQNSFSHSYSWSGFVDGESEIQYYQVFVGESCRPASGFTHPAQSDVTMTFSTSGRRQHVSTGMYYVTVAAVNNAFLVSEPVCSDGLTIDTTPPSITQVVVNNTRAVPGIAKDNQGQVWYLGADNRRSLVETPSAACVARAASAADRLSLVPIRLTHRGRTATVTDAVCMASQNTNFHMYLRTPNHLSLSWTSQDTGSQPAQFMVGASLSRNSSLNVVVPFFSTQLRQRAALLEHSTSGLEQGRSFYLHVRAENNAQLNSEATLGPVHVDATPPLVNGGLGAQYNRTLDALQITIPLGVISDPEATTQPFTYSIAVLESNGGNALLPLTVWSTATQCWTPNATCFTVLRSQLLSGLHSGHRYSVHLRVTNIADLSTTVSTAFNHVEGAPSTGMVVDTAPSQFSRTYATDMDLSREDVDVCVSSTSWSSRWHSFHHPTSAVQYAVGLGSSASSVDDIIAFVPAGGRQDWTFQLQNVSLQPGVVYYSLVRASNEVGSVVVASDGCRFIADVRGLLSQAVVSDGSRIDQDVDVQLSSEVVSAAWQAPTALYVSRTYWRLEQTSPTRQNLTEFQPVANTGRTVTRMALTPGRRYRSVIRLCHAHVCYGDVSSDGFLVSTLPTTGSVRAVYNASASHVQVSWSPFGTAGGQANVDYYEVAIGTSEIRPGEELVTAWQRVAANQNKVTVFLASPLLAYRPASATVRAHVASGHSVMAHSAILWSTASSGVLPRRETLIRPVVYDLARIPLSQPIPATNSDWRQVEQQSLAVESDLQYTPITTRIAAAWPGLRYPEVAWSLSERQAFLACNHGSTVACGTVKGTVLHADVPALVYGRRYYVCISAVAVTLGHEIHNESLPTVLACSDGFTVDNRPPTGGCVWPGPSVLSRPNCTQSPSLPPVTTMEAKSLPVAWQAFGDVESPGRAVHLSGVRFYEIGLGTTAGSDDVLRFKSVGLSLSTVMVGLSLTPCIQYFVTIRGYDFVGRWSQSSSQPILLDTSAPRPGYITLSNSSNPLLLFSASRSSFAANWQGFQDADSTGLRYWWALGSRPGGSSDILPYTSVASAVSAMATTVLQDGRRVFVSVQATNDAGLSTLVTSPGFMVDTSPPSAGLVLDGGNGASVSVVFDDSDYSSRSDSSFVCRWSGFRDAHSTVVGYELALGSCSSCTDVQDWMSLGLVTAFRRENLPLESGQTYYCRIRACNAARLCSMAVSDGIVFDPTPPILGVVAQYMLTSASRQHITASASGFLDPQSSILSYYGSVGTVAGGSDIIPPSLFFQEPAFDYFNLMAPLPRNQTLYVTATVFNRAGSSAVQTSQPFSVDVTTPTAAPGSSPVLVDEMWGGSRLSGTQVSAEGIRLSWQFVSPQSAIESHTVTLVGTARRFARYQLQLGSEPSAVLRTALSDGESYTAHVTACNAAKACTTASSAALLVDSSPPIAGYFSADTNTSVPLSTLRQDNPTWNSAGQSSTATFRVFGFSDPHSGITHFTVDIGSSYFGKDLANATRVTIQGPSRSPESLQVQLSRRLLNGERIYVSVTAWNGVGLQSRPLVRSFLARASAADNSTGALILERSVLCQVTSCSGHCTCPLNSGFCSSDSSTCSQLIASSLPVQDRVTVHVTPSLRQLVPMRSIATARTVHAFWSVALNSSRRVLWYDWSVGRDGELPGAGVFNVATEPVWYPVGQLQQVTVSLSESQQLRHAVLYIFYVRAWYSMTEFAVFTSLSFFPDLMSPVRIPGSVVRDIGSGGVSAGDVDYTTSTTRLSISWDGVFDARMPSSVSRFEVALGTQPGVDDAFPRAMYPATATLADLTTLSLRHGVRYFATVTAVSGTDQRTSVSSDGVRVDTSSPQTGVISVLHQSRLGQPTSAVPSAADARLYANSANDPESRMTSFSLSVGTFPGESDVMYVDGSRFGVSPYWSLGSALLQHNTTYYLSLTGTNGAGLNTTSPASTLLVLDTTRPTTYTCQRQTARITNPSFENPAASCPSPPPSLAQSLIGWTADAGRVQLLVSSNPAPGHGCVSVMIAGGALSQNITTAAGSSYRLEAYLSVENCYSQACRNQTLASTLLQLRVGTQVRTVSLSPRSPVTSPAWRRYSMTFTAADTLTTISVASADPLHMVAVGMLQVTECTQPTATAVSLGDPIRVYNSTAVTLQQTYLSHDAALLSAQWQIADDESGVVEYRWALGSVAGGEQYQTLTSVGQSTSADSRLLHLPQGANVYVTVLARNGAGQERLVSSVRHVADQTPPVIGTVLDGVADADYQNSLEVAVSLASLVEAESAIEQCTWAVGSSPSLTDDVLPSIQFVPTSVARRNLSSSTSHGQRVYSRVCCANAAGLSSCATSDGVTILTAAPSVQMATVRLLAADQGVYSADPNIIAQTSGLYLYVEGVTLPQYVSYFEGRFASGTPWLRVGNVDAAAIRGLSLDDGDLQFHLRSIDMAGQVSSTLFTNFTVDTSVPRVASGGMVNLTRLSNTSVDLDWSGYFVSVAASLRYELSIGSAYSGSDIVQTLELMETWYQASSLLFARPSASDVHVTLTVITSSGLYLPTSHVLTLSAAGMGIAPMPARASP